MKNKEIKLFFDVLYNQNPEPKTELIYNSNFELLVAVLLSAQATDISVNKATKELFKIANNPEKILNLGQIKLENYIKTIGLYKSKAKYLIETCKILIEKFNCEIPNNRQDLESLPGVGRKTANVILNVAFNQETMAVDTHIFRISNRTKLATGKTPLEVEIKLLKKLKNLPMNYRVYAHHWLILLGRYVCQARKPKCSQCLVERFCKFENKNIFM